MFTACKAFIVRDGKVLMLRESKEYEDGTHEGEFDFPGGRVAPGEHFDEGLRREVREETGLEVRIVRPILVDEWRPVVRGEHWHIVGIFFYCEVEEGDLNVSSDHVETAWVDPTNHQSVPVIEMYRRVLDTYVTNIRS